MLRPSQIGLSASSISQIMSDHGPSRGHRLTNYFVSTVALASAIAGGCGDGRPPTYPVHGSVHFTDGRPVSVGIVEFRLQSDGRIARGRIDRQGHFQLGTFDNNDGVLAGKHQVIVTQHFDPRVWSTNEAPNHALVDRQTQHQHAAGLVHRRFADYRTSGLIAVVKPQTDNLIDLDVGEPVPLPGSRRSNR
jgi:hypothetical protein